MTDTLAASVKWLIEVYPCTYGGIDDGCVCVTCTATAALLRHQEMTPQSQHALWLALCSDEEIADELRARGHKSSVVDSDG